MMRSVSSFTPHFYEDVTQSMTQLQDSGAESASMLSILSALYPDECENLRERIDMEVGGFGGLERRGSNVGNVARANIKDRRLTVEQDSRRETLDAAVLRKSDEAKRRE